MTRNTISSPPVYGLETEYSCTMTYPGGEVFELVGACHAADNETATLFSQPAENGFKVDDEDTKTALRSLGLQWNQDTGMLSNGGRFYIDPSGPEYDTPECTTAEELVHRVFAGDAVVYGLFAQLRETGVLQSFQLNRHVVDHNRASRGIHQNSTTSLPLEPNDQVVGSLATINGLKGALFGSGGLLVNEQGETEFHHSPRLSLTDALTGHYSLYTMRPLVRMPFKQDGELGRIETVTSDALNFAWPLRASLVLTRAVTVMLEQEIYVVPNLRSPERAARIVGQHGNGNLVSILDNDKHYGMYPAQVITQICEDALNEHEHRGLFDDEVLQVLKEIIFVSDILQNNPEDAAIYVESIARKLTLQRAMKKFGVMLSSDKICRQDYLWDMIGGGTAERLREKGKAGWHGFKAQPSPADSKRRKVNPPIDTRAKLRGKLILNSCGENQSDWDKIQPGPGRERIYVHPLTTSF